MQQLTHQLKNGNMRIFEVPVPCMQKGQILIKNHYSLISAGTEGSTVKAARKGYIGKAKERPQQMKQVIDTLITKGPVQTYRSVMKKLEAYSPLGYSCVGEVIDISSDIKSFCSGDLVACGGLTASHSEVVSVPANLCVKLKPDVDLKQSAYNTLGAIAIQGVRQADMRLAETCAIIGLGLLGQLTAMILKTSGVRVVGIDIDPVMVDIAEKHSLDFALNRNDAGIKEKIYQITDGIGCDAVIITAASSSLDPINFAGAIARKKGTIVVLGAVPTGFDREPYFYKKELQIKMSCSYGPGRYDPNYEDKGIDYPPAYVRWTENRNMQAFQWMIYTKKIDISYLTTHMFTLDEAPAAYDLIMSKSEPFIGILIEYDSSKEINLDVSKVLVKQPASLPQSSEVNIGFIGAGSHAQSYLLPHIPKTQKVQLKGVLNASSTSARSVAERFGFEFCTGNGKDIIKNKDINTIFIATRHDSHVNYVLNALRSGKHVFVEKPLCLTFDELEEIKKCYDGTALNHQQLMVGYNRRFSPLARAIKNNFGSECMAMTYRVNAGTIPADSWVQDADLGGGRIIGEVCHFVDFLTYINGSLPTSVFAAAMREPDNLNDVVNICLSFQNGSIGNICYFANGDVSLPKERFEAFCNGNTAVLEDFKTLTIYTQGKKKEKKLLHQDKGQKAEVRQFVESILNGTGPIIPIEEIYNSSLVTFKILESIRSGRCIKI